MGPPYTSSSFGAFMRNSSYVTVVNRSDRPIEGTYDGKSWIVQPGENHIPESAARKIKAQNPVMGSEDPGSGQMDFWVGVKEWGDPIDPITSVPEAKFGERWNRDLAPYMQGVESRQGFAKQYRSQVVGTPLPLDANFTPNTP